MPKPIFGDNGSGMHCHQSIWKADKNLFAGDKYAGLSEVALYYIGGHHQARPRPPRHHQPRPQQLPPLGSWLRGAGQPGVLVAQPLGLGPRPVASSPKAKRIEFRCPDPMANPYLAFAAMLLAGIDGIQNKIKPGEPMDKDIYELPPEELRDIPKAPGSLEEALENLKKDHAFLLKGDVFTKEVVETWIWWKEENELKPSRLRPTAFDSRSTSTHSRCRQIVTRKARPQRWAFLRSELEFCQAAFDEH
jgi:glutamine synthetase